MNEDEGTAGGMRETYRETYREESRELLEKLEKLALELAAAPGDPRPVPEMFRALHTIKGTAAMFEYEEVAKIAHALESLFANIRDGKLAASRETAELTLEVVDLLNAWIRTPLSREDGEKVFGGRKDSLLARIKTLDLPARETEPAPRRAVPSAEGGGRATYRVRFRPRPDIFRKGVNPEAMLRELASFGECRMLALLDDVPALEDIDPERCYAAWDILLTTTRDADAIKDVFIFVEDQSALTVELIESEAEEAGVGPIDKRLGEILLERGDITREDLRRALERPRRIGEALAEARVVGNRQLQAALNEQEYLKELKRVRRDDLRFQSLRVKAEKADELVNLVGELVTFQERLKTTALRCGANEVALILEESERVVEQLRHSAMSMRLLALDTLFSRFRRLVHDLASELGKKVELEIAGAETELDKSIIERLNDPLVHVIRNCLDHGLEPAAERTAAGKPPAGRIAIRAYHAEANVVIEVEDDGRGLDREKIAARARERGLLPDGRTTSDEELLSLIFLPGFSTAVSVSEISGRGVGMDVVRRTIETLGGRVRVKSIPGRGTTVTLKIPLTLSIIEGLFVRVGGEQFVVPLLSVEECVEIDPSAAAAAGSPEATSGPSPATPAGANAARVLSVRGELLPYVRLREHFGIGGAPPAFEKVVVVRSERRLGFAVDEVLGTAQVVIKSLAGPFAKVEGILGATVTGDGTVSLILDVGRIAATAENEEAGRRRERALRAGRAG
jgi:two-component system chemotaxis sensor kinase CheA